MPVVVVNESAPTPRQLPVVICASCGRRIFRDGGRVLWQRQPGPAQPLFVHIACDRTQGVAHAPLEEFLLGVVESLEPPKPPPPPPPRPGPAARRKAKTA